MRTGSYILIMLLGVAISCLAAYSRDEARQVWAGLSIFQTEVSEDNTAKHVLTITTLHPEHPQSIAGLVTQAKQNQNRWSVALWLGVCTSAVAMLGIAVETSRLKRKRIIEPKVRQVSSESAPSASPDEPST